MVELPNLTRRRGSVYGRCTRVLYYRFGARLRSGVVLKSVHHLALEVVRPTRRVEVADLDGG